ncbi:hypothetical protein TSAR_011733 [Trichomalopsis sarcophagae]|uniref:Uncharacterized protein n=1 Tax=Trichomalopsis sarcophagae TaxID=543379 RepID=A0A232FC76_9HYME|nr:hypothetical protein TSAR_011733 [Trichomalopsis sarcophagae]
MLRLLKKLSLCFGSENCIKFLLFSRTPSQKLRQNSLSFRRSVWFKKISDYRNKDKLKALQELQCWGS